MCSKFFKSNFNAAHYAAFVPAAKNGTKDFCPSSLCGIGRAARQNHQGMIFTFADAAKKATLASVVDDDSHISQAPAGTEPETVDTLAEAFLDLWQETLQAYALDTPQAPPAAGASVSKPGRASDGGDDA